MPISTDLAIYGQIFINDSGDREGWSEGYWLKATDYDDALAALADDLWPARRALMSSDAQCKLLRVSKTNVRGDTKVFRPKPINKSSTTADDELRTFSGFTALGNACLFLRFEAANPKIRAIHPIHGLPWTEMDDVEAIRQWKPQPSWIRRFDRFVRSLKDNCCLISNQGVITSDNYSLSLVAGLASGSNAAGVGPIKVGDLVTGYGIPKKTYVTFLGSTTVGLSQQATTTAADVQLKFKHKKPLDIQRANIESVIMPDEVRFRKLGRPFGLLQGRRRNR